MKTYGLSVVTAPTDLPVTLDQAKTQSRVEVDETYWDADLSILIQAATALVESRADLSICDQTRRLTLPRFPRNSCPIYVPRGPARAISSIKYDDAAGDEQTFDAADYNLSAGERPQRIVLVDGAFWPTTELSNPNAVRIEYTAGAASVAAVDPIARQLVLFLVAYWFRNREAVATEGSAVVLPMAAESLLAQLGGAEEFIDYGVEP